MHRLNDLQKKIYELWKKEKWYWCAAVVIGVTFSVVFGAYWTKGYSQIIQNGISAKVVRFHVLANSDTKMDQSLKIKVRDAVLAEYGELLSTCTSKEETLEKLEGAKAEICKTAQKEVLAQGYDYEVSVSLVREDFPYKRYDDLVFPAGVYDALRIEIGEAKGQNWWCVLYPQMCYVDASWGYTTDESYQRLENSLTKEEFLVVSAMSQEDITPKVKFKVVEWWQEKG